MFLIMSAYCSVESQCTNIIGEKSQQEYFAIAQLSSQRAINVHSYIHIFCHLCITANSCFYVITVRNWATTYNDTYSCAQIAMSIRIQ